MAGAAALQSAHTQQGWNPLVSYTEENIEHDEVIYYQAPRNLAYRIDPEYKVITRSTKPGYVTPDGNFTAEIQQTAQWVIVGDHSSAETKADVDHAVNAGVLTRTASIDATRQLKIGDRSLTTIGRQWQIYRVTTNETTVEPLITPVESRGRPALGSG
jgi:hypothetical protein